jgi:murein DD-endopeptidase MepM/ murein hydrolase activator NlpD
VRPLVEDDSTLDISEHSYPPLPDLNEMEGSLHDYELTQKAFSNVTEDELGRTGKVQNRAREHLKDLAQRQAPPPARSNRPAAIKGQSAQAKLQTLKQAVLQAAFGVSNTDTILKGLTDFVSTLGRRTGREGTKSADHVKRALSNGEKSQSNSPVDQSGKNTFLPVGNVQVNSEFQAARPHPVLGITRPHRGMDFKTPLGTEVKASDSGTVEDAGTYSTGEDFVKIHHDDGSFSVYMHTDGSVEPGQHVTAGDVIGTTNKSGPMSGPHLHYEYHDEKDKPVNPRSHLPL